MQRKKAEGNADSDGYGNPCVLIALQYSRWSKVDSVVLRWSKVDSVVLNVLLLVIGLCLPLTADDTIILTCIAFIV